ALAVRDPELLLHNLRDARAGPDLSAEAIGLRAMPEEVRQQTPLLGAESGGMAGGRPRQQGVGPAGARGGQPLADRPFGGTEGDGDVALLPAKLFQAPGLHAPPRPRIGGIERLIIHASL